MVAAGGLSGAFHGALFGRHFGELDGFGRGRKVVSEQSSDLKPAKDRSNSWAFIVVEAVSQCYSPEHLRLPAAKQ